MTFALRIRHRPHGRHYPASRAMRAGYTVCVAYRNRLSDYNVTSKKIWRNSSKIPRFA